MRLRDWPTRPTPPRFILVKPKRGVCLRLIICQCLLQARVPATNCVCLQHMVGRHVLQARVPVKKARVPAAYYLRTIVAGTRACNESACACSISFADNCCRRTCLQRVRACLQHLLCGHVLQARVTAMKTRVPASHYSQHLK